MVMFRLRRKSLMKRLPRRRAPLLPEPRGRTGLSRRVNRLDAAVALFGAFGAFALALALMPGTQPSRSSAEDSQGQLAISEVKPQPPAAAEASPPAPVLAALPQQAAKPDRLSRSIRAPQPAAADRVPDTRSLRGPIRDEVGERDIAMARERPNTASRAAASSEPVLEPDFDVEASKSPAPGNTGVDDIDTGGEVSAPEIDEASDETLMATRSAAVTTDVNMRAGPDNAAAVIMVVPGKSDVEVIGCDDWCEVVFAGKRGWIYQRFVGAADSTAVTSGTTGVAETTGRVAETKLRKRQEAGIPTALAARRAPVGIDGIGRLATLDADDLRQNLHALDPGDVRKLKTTCAEALRTPAAYSADTRAVCELVTSL